MLNKIKERTEGLVLEFEVIKAVPKIKGFEDGKRRGLGLWV